MKHYVVIDLEMCRVPKSMKKQYGYKNGIIQIGAVLMDSNLDVTDKFNRYVKPQYGELDGYISKLTGITDENLKDAPYITTALNEFLEWLPDDEVVAVSWGDADEHQFRKELEAKEIVVDSRFMNLLDNWIDCQPQFTSKMKTDTKKQYSLEEALIATDICTDGRAHNGLDDAYNTALLYAKMQREDELVLNPYYKSAHYEIVEDLSYDIGDILAKAGFE